MNAWGYFDLVLSDKGFSNFNADGTLGLGLNVYETATPTFIDQLKTEGRINERIFAIYLNHLGRSGQYDGYGNPASSLEIGSYNLEKYSTDDSFILTLDVEPSGY